MSEACEGCGDGLVIGHWVRHKGYCPMCSDTIDIIEEVRPEEPA